MRHVLLFLATAGLTTFCLGRLMPPVTLPVVETKLRAFAEHKDEWNVLLVGTSQTFHGVDPSAFDAHLRAAGIDTRTFNLGFPGSGLAEQHGYLRRIAAMRPARLRWLLVEAERVMRVGDEGDTFLTPKLIGMTDPTTAVLLWPYFGDVEPRWWRLHRARWRTLVAASYHLAGVGSGIPWVEELLDMGPTEAERLEFLGEHGDGYTWLERADRVAIANRRDRYVVKDRQMQRRVLRLEQFRGPPEAALPSALPFFTRIEAVGRAMGAEVVFFTIRRGALHSEATALAREGAIGKLVSFDEPQLFPELYDVDFTFDGGHFNREGALVFTRYLADAFAKLAKSKVQ